MDSAEVGDTQVNIRGINGARDAENSYALIVDGVLMTNPAALNREYANLSQIEILKGPQGALYGRNAAAGAIVITTGKPGDETGGYFKASAAATAAGCTRARSKAPWPEGINFRLQADYRSTEGFYENSYLNGARNVDDYRGYNINARMTWDPTDDSSWDFKFRRGEVSAASITFNAAFICRCSRNCSAFRSSSRTSMTTSSCSRAIYRPPRQRAGSHGVLGPC